MAPRFMIACTARLSVTSCHEVSRLKTGVRFRAVAYSPLASFAQPVNLLPVCELLAQSKSFNGEPVAVLGQLDCQNSVIDHTCFLAEDRCAVPVTAEGYTWPNKVFLQDDGELAPPLPAGGLKLEEKAVAENSVSSANRLD
jgi:hypothetical protein